MALSSPPFSGGSLSSDSEISNVSSPKSQINARPTPRKAHCKNPSKQRRNASEKEKLRMRDLTKALHNLRRFLPPFVAPAGQTLTKIETLRLAIRYISYLSAQLHLQMAHCQNPELRSPHHGSTSHTHTHTHSAGNLETDAFQFQQSQPPDDTFYQAWTPQNEKTTPYRPHSSGGVRSHMTFQSDDGFNQTETGQRGRIKAEIPECDEIFGFHMLTNPRTFTSKQGSGEDEQRERAAHDVWI